MHNDRQPLFSSFSRKLAAVILFLLLISLIALVLVWYEGTIESLDNEFSNRQNLTDQILAQSVIWIDRGISLYELQYVPSLQDAMEIYHSAYQNARGDMSQLNLSAVKERIEDELEGSYDLYLINEDGIVIKSTFSEDIGLDFKIWPKFFALVTQIRKEGQFVPDRMVRGHAKDAPFRKFAYMGTSDGKYLLEISRNFDRLLPYSTYASYKELITNLPKINTDIRRIELYNTRYTIISRYPANTSELPSAETVSKVIKTFKEKVNFAEIDPKTGEVIRYTHLPIGDTKSPSASEMYLVAKTVYSTDEHEKKKSGVTFILGVFLFLTATIAAGGAIAGSRYLSRPIDRIVEDIQIIADGDLDHRIRPTGSSEFIVIENAINQLVAALKETIASLTTREEELVGSV